MTEQELMVIKKRLESKKIEEATKKGQLEELKNKLKKEFDVQTPRGAKDKLAQMDEKLTKMESGFDGKVAEFNSKYSHLLNA